MPQKRAAYKHLRKSGKKHLRNITVKSELRTLVKKFNSLLEEKNPAKAKEFLKGLSSKMQKAATKGIIHKNTVSRKISRLSKKLTSA